MACTPTFLIVAVVISCSGGGARNEPRDVDPVRGGKSQASEMLSRYRQANGLGAVVQDPRLQRVAQAQADAMARADLMSHTVAGGLASRFVASGAPCGTCAENIGAGQRGLGQIFDSWKHSPEHNANMLNPSMRRVGVASARAPGSRYGVYWAMDLAE